jgi:tripartite-type tricarboxylate transporter receptor subunit TctC
MKTLNRRRFAASLVVAACAAQARAADSLANRPVKVIVPYAPGGLSDFMVRTVGEPMARRLGLPLVVDYKAGATGMLGAQFVATSAADGHTLLFANNALVIARHATARPSYDAVAGFLPIGLISQTPMLFITNSAVPARNMQEFLEYARGLPRGVDYGSAGILSFGHVTVERFAREVDLKMVHVPYKGGGPMTLALRSGEIKLLVTTPSADILSLVQAGNFRLLAVASAEPMVQLPEVPLVSSVVPGFEAQAWYGLFAPVGVTPSVQAVLSAALQSVLASADVYEKFTDLHHVLGTGTPSQLAAIVQRENERWARLIPTLGIKLD